MYTEKKASDPVELEDKLKQPVKNYSSVERWLRRLKTGYRSPGGFQDSSTRRGALYFLSLFCDYVEMTPDEIIDQRRRQIKSDDILEQRFFEEQVEGWGMFLRDEKEYAPASARTAVGYIQSFFKHNYSGLVNLSLPAGYPTKDVTVPRRGQLRKIVELAEHLRQRLDRRPNNFKKEGLPSWILCQAESGLSNQDLLDLTLDQTSPEYGTIGVQLENGQVPLHIRIVRTKTAAAGIGWHDTFLGRNAVEALQKYVDPSRNQIFTFTAAYVRRLVKDVSMKVGVGSKDAPVTPYCFRRYFKTRLNLANVNELTVEYWMGHKIPRVKAGYNAPAVEDQMRVYQEAYPLLDINRE